MTFNLTIPEDFAKITKLKEEYKKQVQAAGRELLEPVFKGLFESFPELKGIEWRQYTPYFNDGEACVFNVYDIYALMSPVKGVDGIYSEYRDDKDLADYSSYVVAKFNKKLYEALDQLERFMGNSEDIFENIFGDGVKVTVTPEGFEVEEYDHD